MMISSFKDVRAYEDISANAKRQRRLVHNIDSRSVKPLSHQTALPQCLYSVLKPCQRAVRSPRNTRKNIKCVGYSVYTTSSQRSYSVHTTFPQRFSAFMTFSQRVRSCCSVFQRAHDAHTARRQRTHSVITARTQRPHGDYSV